MLRLIPTKPALLPTRPAPLPTRIPELCWSRRARAAADEARAAADEDPEASVGGVFFQGSRGPGTARQGEVVPCHQPREIGPVGIQRALFYTCTRGRRRRAPYAQVVRRTSQIQNADFPKDVSSLITGLASTDAAPVFDRAPLEKARPALNELVEKAWIELVDKIFGCKGDGDRTRETHGQVTRELIRLRGQIKDLSRMNSEAIDLMTHRIRGEEEHARAAHTADAIAHDRAGAMKQSLWGEQVSEEFV
jgi:hypothetical protein